MNRLSIGVLLLTLSACGWGEVRRTGEQGAVLEDALIVIAGQLQSLEQSQNQDPGAVSPAEVTLAPGAVVRFENRDDNPHQIVSDPHGAHTGCPALNGPVLEPGDSISFQLPEEPVVCGYHDELAPEEVSMRGIIRVVAPQ